jgi:hypothetical protein
LLGRVDLLFTNPPFGSKIPVTNRIVLEQYELGHVWTYDKASDRWLKTDLVQKQQPPEILFIERCVQFLKPGTGRAAIVLPDGVLGSPGLGYVRQWILENTRVKPPANAALRPGYLVTALSHPTLGRPLVKAMAYGSTIPHIDVNDVQTFPVVRLGDDAESAISAAAEAAAKARAEADLLEQAMARDAGRIVEEFTHRPTVRLASSAPPPNADAEFAALAERWRAERPRGADVADMAATPAYRAVVAMGDRAVRPILLQLKRKPEHWFAALNEITAANPVPPEAEGRLKGMAEAWVRWGRERGYIGELD